MAVVFAVIFGIGVVAGLRSMTAPMVVSWGARLGWLDVSESSAAFLNYAWTPYVLTALAIGELVVDKLPQAPSRKAVPAFAFRLIVGASLGATIAAAGRHSIATGAACGALGALVGTLGGYEARTRLAPVLRVPGFAAALVEDAIAVGGGFLLISL